ncbi:hypothetical protein KKD42_03755 [Patescibacteria group bacterium]|nr:hypothetical protein [Patescibacteria group bacterium]
MTDKGKNVFLWTGGGTLNNRIIRGDHLLLALRFLERKYVEWSSVRFPPFPKIKATLADALRANIAHPYGAEHWYAQIAIRTHARATLESMDPSTRKLMFFNVVPAARLAVDAASDPDLPGGLSNEDKERLITSLTHFFAHISCIEIKAEFS